MPEIDDVRHHLDRFGRLRDVDHIVLPSLTREELFSLGDRPAFGESADPSTVSVHPDVRLVLAVRSEPAFLSLIGLRGRPEPLVRAYGFLDERAQVAPCCSSVPSSPASATSSSAPRRTPPWR